MAASLDLGLEGRVAIVTGAASGMGRSVAALLADAGATVHGVDIDADGLRRARASWSGAGHSAGVADLGQVQACRDVVSDAVSRHRRVDFLVAVHALLIRKELADVEEADFDRLWTVNARSQFFLCQAVLPGMAERRFGRIVLFTSPGGFIGATVRSSAYATTKSASLGLSRSIARRYGPCNITCNLVSPGVIDTPMGNLDLSADEIAAIEHAIPLRRRGTPDEVARAAVFLVSEWAGYVNGHVLVVDGGNTMHA